MREEKGFYMMLNDLGEWETPHLKAHLLYKTQTKPSHIKTKTKDRAQSSGSVLKYCPLETKAAAKCLSRYLSFFPAAVWLQIPSWKLHVELAQPWPCGHMGSRVTGSCAPGPETVQMHWCGFNRLVREGESEREIETPSCGPWAMWH